MRRWLAVLIVLIVIVLLVVWRAPDVLWRVEPPIRVGILHSKSGPMATIEQAMIDAEVLALEEIKAEGGLLGRPVEWVIADGQSDLPMFASGAEQPPRDEPAIGCGLEPIGERNQKYNVFYPRKRASRSHMWPTPTEILESHISLNSRKYLITYYQLVRDWAWCRDRSGSEAASFDDRQDERCQARRYEKGDR